jgi:hypothetical protein
MKLGKPLKDQIRNEVCNKVIDLTDIQIHYQIFYQVQDAVHTLVSSKITYQLLARVQEELYETR